MGEVNKKKKRIRECDISQSHTGNAAGILKSMSKAKGERNVFLAGDGDSDYCAHTKSRLLFF